MTLVDDRSKPVAGSEAGFDHSAGVIIVGNRVENISSWNVVAQSLLVWKREEAIGRSSAGFIFRAKDRGASHQGIQTCVEAITHSDAGL